MLNLNEIRFAVKMPNGNLITAYGNGVPFKNWADANRVGSQRTKKDWQNPGKYGEDYTVVPVKIQILEIS